MMDGRKYFSFWVVTLSAPQQLSTSQATAAAAPESSLVFIVKVLGRAQFIIEIGARALLISLASQTNNKKEKRKERRGPLLL